MSSRTGRMRGALLASVSLAVMMIAGAQGTAMASCSPDSVSAGGFVNCTGADTDGFETEEANVGLEVVEGAVVDGAPAKSASISLGGGGSLLNAGTIVFNDADGEPAGHAIFSRDHIDIVNNGLIEARSSGSLGLSIGIETGSDAYIENNGEILVDAMNQAIGIATGSEAVVVNDGTVTVTGALAHGGISMQHESTLLNRGTVSVTSTGTRGSSGISARHVANSGVVTVVSGGSSFGGDVFGIIALPDGSVVNSGTVEVTGTGQSGVVRGVLLGFGGSKGSMENSGMIVVETKAAHSEAYGIDLGSDAVIVINSGDIIVRSADEEPVEAYGIHVSSSFGDIEISNEAGGSIKSDGVAVFLGEGNTLVNDGKIEGLFGVDVGENSVLVNSGSITATNPAILVADGAKVTNSGVIRTGMDLGAGILGAASGTVISNSGIIESDIGIVVFDDGTIDNSGTINASTWAIATRDREVAVNHEEGVLRSAGFGITGNDDNDILNEGLLVGEQSGISFADGNNRDINGDGFAGITNTGTIKAFVGIRAEDANVITNLGAIEAEWGVEVFGDDNVIDNQGSIDAGTAINFGGDDSSVINGGEIAARTGIVAAFGQRTKVVNTGSIDAEEIGIRYQGVQTTNEASILNMGVITSDAIAVLVEQGGIVDNQGTISGEQAVVGSKWTDRIVNSGTVTGDWALGGGGDTVELLTGSVLDGVLDFGSPDGDGNLLVKGVSTLTGGVRGADIGVLASLTLHNEISSEAKRIQIIGGALDMTGAMNAPVEIKALTENGVTRAGILTGAFSLTGNLVNGGILAPGGTIGTVSIDGDYTQNSSGTLAVELGQSGDLVGIIGSATLDGTLTTALLGTNIAALEGRQYTVLTADDGITGGFQNAGLIQQGFWTLDVEQTGTAVTVTVVDVDLTIGASVPFTGALADAIGNAAPATAPQGAGIVVEGHTDTATEGDQQQAALSYDSLGDWESAAASYTGGFVGLGVRTPATSMPKTGTAAFEGTTKGELTETASGAPEAFVVEGNVMLTANFASGLVNADFTGMEKIDADGVASAWVDFRARMSIADGTSAFAGTAGTDDGVWSGEARGGFFGDEGGMPGHAAGLWSMSSPLGRALGGFTAKRQ